MPSLITRSQLYREAVQTLTAKGVANASNEAFWLLEYSINLTKLAIHSEPGALVAEEDHQTARRIIQQRASGKPIQYILGTQEFYGRDFFVHPEVLIPRPESELLIQALVSALQPVSAPLLIDVGTGSGCLAVTLTKELPKARCFATDLSLAAIRTAKDNAIRHEVLDRIGFCLGDLLSPLLSTRLAGKVAGIAANLPYIPEADWANLSWEVRGYEPRLALDGGPDGLAPHRRLLRQSRTVLASGGLLVLELGPGQAQGLSQEVERAGVFEVVEIRRDSLNIDRVMCLVRRD